MAISTTPFAYATASVVVPGTSVVPSLALPENCHTVLVSNSSSTVTALIGIATAGTALVAGVNATPIPPGSTLTLAIGTSTTRGFMLASGSAFVYDAGAGLTIAVTYMCALGTLQ